MGWHVAQVLTRAFPSIDELKKASEEDLNAVEGIGPEIARSVFEWFHDKENVKLLNKLAKAGVRMKDDAVAAPPEGPLSGQTIVLTGGLESMSRDEARSAAEEAGARVASSVSKKTDFVVAGENPGSKFEKARVSSASRSSTRRSSCHAVRTASALKAAKPPSPPAVFVSILKPFTAEVESSPQVPPDATAKLVMSTVAGSFTVALRGPVTPLSPLSTESDGHPFPRFRSNAPFAFTPQNGA